MQNTSKSFRLNLLHEGLFMHYTGEFYANHLRRDLGLALSRSDWAIHFPTYAAI